MNELTVIDPCSRFLSDNLHRLAFGNRDAWAALTTLIYPRLVTHAKSLLRAWGTSRSSDFVKDVVHDTWLACWQSIVQPTHPAASVESAIEDPATHLLTLDVRWNRESWKNDADKGVASPKPVVVDISVIGLTRDTKSPVVLMRTQLRFTEKCRVRTLEVPQSVVENLVELSSLRVVTGRSAGYFMTALYRRVLRLCGGDELGGDEREPEDERELAPEVDAHNRLVSLARPAHLSELTRWEWSYWVMSRKLGFDNDSEIARRMGISDDQVQTLALRVERKLGVLEALRLLSLSHYISSREQRAAYLKDVRRCKLDEIAECVGCDRGQVTRVLALALDKVDAMIAMLSLAWDRRLAEYDADFLETWLFDDASETDLAVRVKLVGDEFCAYRRRLGCRLHARILTDRDRHHKGLLRNKAESTGEQAEQADPADDCPQQEMSRTGTEKKTRGKQKEIRRAYLESRFVWKRSRHETATELELSEPDLQKLEEELNVPWLSARTLVSHVWTLPSLLEWP